MTIATITTEVDQDFNAYIQNQGITDPQEIAAKRAEFEATVLREESGLTDPRSVQTVQAVAPAGENSDISVMRKIVLGTPASARAIEIRPPLRRLPNETPFIIEMVDNLAKPCAIYLMDGVYIGPLKLTPNPDSFVINSAKMINRYQTMTRWVEEHWGDEIDTISFSGSTFSFTAISSTPDENVGLTVSLRNRTAPYELLRKLVQFYRFNGCIYQDSVSYEGADAPAFHQAQSTATVMFLADNPSFQGNHPRAGMVKERLYIRVSFDYISMIGYFDSFDITEDASSPYKFTYSLTFKAERTKFLVG